MSNSNSLTHSFKSSNRKKPPIWSNRFRRDVNDLMYHPKDLKDIQYIKKTPHDKNLDGTPKKMAGSNPMKNAM